ncbi:MAG: hypothetical protein GX329_07235 [Tissierellia bacterium]|mgnify:CR=1 FL=1|nr:hypothetical protein [Tissierellia bacterium]
MSNIIRSSRVIESNIVYNQGLDIQDPIEEKLIEEAIKKHDLILAAAEKEAKEIMESAHIVSEKKMSEAYEEIRMRYKKAMAQGYDEGYKSGLDKGYDEGYRDGFKQGEEDSEQLIAEALDIKNDYIAKRNNALRSAEKELIELIISIYEKVLHKKIEDDEDLVVSLVLNGIDNLEIARKLTIIVPKESYRVVEENKDKILAKVSSVNELDIRVNSDMKQGDCIIETSRGSVDVSIDNQLEEVKDLLTTILSNE